jgi:hypothetical protein
MKDFTKLAKDYLERLNNLIEQDEDDETISSEELIEKFNNYEKQN